MTVIIEDVIPDGNLTIAELTEVSLDGNGIFDKLVRTFLLHLDDQFQKDRITGTAYASTFAQIYPSLLQYAIGYAATKAKLAPELKALELQNSTLVLQQDQIKAQTAKLATDTALAFKQGHLVDAQVCQTEAETNRINAEVGLRLPAEVDNLTKQGIKISADTANVVHQTGLVDANVCQTNAQTARINLENSLKLPEEVKLLKNQVLQVGAQADLNIAQRNNVLADTDKVRAETLNIPKQGELISAQIIKMQNESDLALIQVDLANKELLVKEKTLTLLDKQILSQQAQNDLYAQKVITEKAQTDPSVIKANSIIDYQNKMMKAQADGFKRDAEQKAAKIMVDTWSLRKNTDPDGNPENDINKLSDTNIGLAIEKMFSGVGVSL